MSRFRVGDLVQVIDGPTFINDEVRMHIGHVGKIEGISDYFPGNFYVEGARKARNGNNASFNSSVLRLLRPPSWDKFIFSTSHLDSPIEEKA